MQLRTCGKLIYIWFINLPKMDIPSMKATNSEPTFLQCCCFHRLPPRNYIYKWLIIILLLPPDPPSECQWCGNPRDPVRPVTLGWAGDAAAWSEIEREWHLQFPVRISAKPDDYSVQEHHRPRICLLPGWYFILTCVCIIVSSMVLTQHFPVRALDLSNMERCY